MTMSFWEYHVLLFRNGHSSICIDELLEWGHQIDHIARDIYAFDSAKKYQSIENLKSLYFSFVHSELFVVWSNDLELCVLV